MLREIFTFFDKESAGVMKTSELALALRSSGFLVTEKESKELVSKYDPEGTGAIDIRYAEWSLYVEILFYKHM